MSEQILSIGLYILDLLEINAFAEVFVHPKTALCNPVFTRILRGGGTQLSKLGKTHWKPYLLFSSDKWTTSRCAWRQFSFEMDIFAYFSKIT